MTPTDRSYYYQIALEGHLEERWLRWLEGIANEHRPEGITILQGMMDQSTLHGILNTIRDLGLALISVQRFEDTTAGHPNEPHPLHSSPPQEPNQ